MKKVHLPEIVEEESKEELIQAANDAFGALDDEPTTWVSKEEDVEHVTIPAEASTAVVPSWTGRSDTSWELAKAIGALSCYYRKVEMNAGDFGVSVYVKPDKQDPQKSYTSIAFQKRLSQSFQGAPIQGPVIMMPIAVRFNMLGFPLGTVNSKNALVAKGQGKGRLCDTQINAGIGSLMGLPCDCEGGQNVVVRDAMRFIYQRIEKPCHEYMSRNRELAPMCAHGWNHYCVGDNPSLYWFARFFSKINPEEPDHKKHILDNAKAYNGKDAELMKQIRPHKIFSEDMDLRGFFFNPPFAYRMPMKSEADGVWWKTEESKETGALEVVDLKLVKMSIQEQAATNGEAWLTSELLKPSTIETGAKTGPKQDPRLHNRYQSIGSICVMPLDKASDYTGTTLLELLAFLKTIDPPTPLSVDEMFNQDTRSIIKDNNEELFKKMMRGAVI